MISISSQLTSTQVKMRLFFMNSIIFNYMGSGWWFQKSREVSHVQFLEWQEQLHMITLDPTHQYCWQIVYLLLYWVEPISVHETQYHFYGFFFSAQQNLIINFKQLATCKFQTEVFQIFPKELQWENSWQHNFSDHLTILQQSSLALCVGLISTYTNYVILNFTLVMLILILIFF